MALDFPSNPTDGQVYDNFYYDDAKGTWKSLSAGASPNVLTGPTITDAVITATADQPSTIPLTVKGAASQSANLQEWKNSAGIQLAAINSTGAVRARGFESYNAANNHKTFQVGDDPAGQLELGRTDGVAANPYIDFHSSTSNNDYDSRIQAVGGGGESGNGSINITASAVNVLGMLSVSSQPSFSASGSTSWTTVSPGNPVVFGSVQHNTGSNYNSSNGRFTAPIAGRYMFFFNFYVDGQRQASFRKNGSDYIPTDTAIAMTPTGTATMSASYLFNLAAGDYIQVGCRSGSTSLYFYANHSWFAGYLVG